MFFREELLRHWQCLDRQREYFSHKAITDVESALARLNASMEALCDREDGDRIVSRLLDTIDGITRLSASADPKKSH